MMSRRAVMRLLLVSVVLIFSGETLCVLGPDRRDVHVACHAVLYAGIFLAFVGALFEGTRRLLGLNISR
jgi:hypothetical protein